MASRILLLVALGLVATAVEGFRNDFFGRGGFPFGGGSPMDFVASHVPVPWFQDFPKQLPMRFPKVPSVDEIISTKPKPGQNYHAVYFGISDKDDEGKLLINRNGQVYEQNIDSNSVDSVGRAHSQLDIPNLDLPQFEIPKFHFPSFDILKNLDPNQMKSHVAGPNENFNAVYSQSSSQYKNDNGEVSRSGVSHTIVNDGKSVKEAIIKIEP